MNDGGYMAVSPQHSNIVFCTGNYYNSGYYLAVSHSTDGGTNWGHDTLPQATRGWAIAFDAQDSNRVYVGGDSAYSYPALLITTDLGTTWTMSHSGLAGTVNVLLTVPGGDGSVYAGTSSGVFRSTNAGASWSSTPLTQTIKALVSDPWDPATLYAGTYGAGVYVSTDGGSTWSPMNAGLTCNKVLSLAIEDDGMLLAGTEGGSVFRTMVATGLAGPAGHGLRASPLTVSPNPCREATTVSLGTPLRDPARLDVYDAAGCLVRSSEVRTSSFALRTSGLPPGAYFVRLVAGRETRTARLTVVE